MALDRSKQLAVDALTERLKKMIEERVAESARRGGAQSSWSLTEELKNASQWTGDRFTDEDARRRDRILASYNAGIDKMKKAEEEVWQAIADLLKS
jgi:hypothetical protein